MRQESTVSIESRDYWFKIVEFLQQSLALVDPHEQGVMVWFIGDTSGVFDEIQFASKEEAEDALRRKSFRRFACDFEAQSFLHPPEPPFVRGPHLTGQSTQAANSGSEACKRKS